MSGGYRPGAGRPWVPDLPNAEAFADHLRQVGEMHMHRHSNKRWKLGYVWQPEYARTKKCGTDQCFRKPVVDIRPANHQKVDRFSAAAVV